MIRNIRLMRFLFFFLAFIALARPSPGQEFGKVKVQYEDFDFSILNTPHFSIYYYDSERESVAAVAEMIERWYHRYTDVFGIEFDSRQPIIVYANHPDFQQTNVIPGLISQGIGGVTEGRRNRIVLPLSGVNAEDDHVLGHELVHLFQFVIPGGSRYAGGGAGNLPLWFIEGLAEYLSLGRTDPHTAMWIRDSVLNNDLPSLNKLSRNPNYSPYRFGHSVWSFISGIWGEEKTKMFLRDSFEMGWRAAAQKNFGIKGTELSDQWRSEIERWTSSILENRRTFPEFKEPVWGCDDTVAFSPSVSQAGKKVAFFSRPDGFTLDLFIADVESGKVERRISSSGTNRHFDALQFIDSAGTWSPDKKRFAFIVIDKGDNGIAIADPATGEITGTLFFDQIDAISHLAWSPDGRSIVLSGTYGGIRNLYLYTFEDTSGESGSLKQLTQDGYSQNQPAWSPDGSTIVYAVDEEKETAFSVHAYAEMKIGFIDLDETLKGGGTGRTESLLSFSPEAKHINPYFSPDGKSIYFISDLDGFSDIYRYNLAEEKLYRVTRLTTGVSGPTKLSPALSVSSGTGRLVYSVFREQGFSLYTTEAKEIEEEMIVLDPETGGARLLAGEREANCFLPVVPEPPDFVTRYLHDPGTGLPNDEEIETEDYRPGFTLASVGYLNFGLSVTPFGAELIGQARFLFDDILSNHFISTYLQVSEEIKDWGAETIYINRKNRINWGVAAIHIPSKSSSYTVAETTVEIDGEEQAAAEYTIVTERIFTDEVRLLGEFPINRNHRFEASTGYTRYGFDTEERTVVMTENETVSETTRQLSSPAPLHLSTSSFAYVGDFSFYGFTSPLKGFRYRLEAAPSLGSLNFVSVQADYRHYFFLRYLSFAVRVLHLGRYFGDAESTYLAPINIGSPLYVRGYSPYSFSFEECGRETGTLDCPGYNRLLGSRAVIGNIELRIPLFGTEQLGFINFPFLPATLVGFFDAGFAWRRNEPPVFRIVADSDLRIPVFSAGGAVRINLLGALIMQIYYAYPFQRPADGGHWGLVFASGW